ncbi:MAG: hypothetical protein EBT45_07605 [Alphaproteobacteria bacterium]|nr:hypothetical protein [Alphaproteobacteria bacterium]
MIVQRFYGLGLFKHRNLLQDHYSLKIEALARVFGYGVVLTAPISPAGLGCGSSLDRLPKPFAVGDGRWLVSTSPKKSVESSKK